MFRRNTARPIRHSSTAGIDEQKTQRLCEIFEKCCLFDLRFWDMVYAMGET